MRPLYLLPLLKEHLCPGQGITFFGSQDPPKSSIWETPKPETYVNHGFLIHHPPAWTSASSKLDIISIAKSS